MIKSAHRSRFPNSGSAILWFALLSPLFGLVLGFVVAWLFSSCELVTV